MPKCILVPQMLSLACVLLPLCSQALHRGVSDLGEILEINDSLGLLQLNADLRNAQARARIQDYCNAHLWDTLFSCLQPLDDNTTYVVTGDIDAMWLRDSSAQLHPYISLARSMQRQGLAEGAQLQRYFEGALRRQAQFIRTDPYANAFTKTWDSAGDSRLARGGYVFTGNFELDSGAYFFRFVDQLDTVLHSSVVDEKPVHEAAKMMVALYLQETEHANGKSEYRYPTSPPWELPGPNGLGNPVKYTGMVWSAFRPSDDPQIYGYHVPSNVFLAAQLAPIVRLARTVWKDTQLAADALRLQRSIRNGVRDFGTTMKNGKLVYCYEVDGMGGCKIMDDANVPSLLSLPYLDPDKHMFDWQIYLNTRGLVLSDENPYFFKGAAANGIGSPHTPKTNIWPMALVMQAMTADSDDEMNSVVNTIEQIDVNKKGLVESFDANRPQSITRPWFGWPNALFVEHLLKTRKCSAKIEGFITPEVKSAPNDGPLKEHAIRFYDADPSILRRLGVTLPSVYFTSQ